MKKASYLPVRSIKHTSQNAFVNSVVDSHFSVRKWSVYGKKISDSHQPATIAPTTLTHLKFNCISARTPPVFRNSMLFPSTSCSSAGSFHKTIVERFVNRFAFSLSSLMKPHPGTHSDRTTTKRRSYPTRRRSEPVIIGLEHRDVSRWTMTSWARVCSFQIPSLYFCFFTTLYPGMGYKLQKVRQPGCMKLVVTWSDLKLKRIIWILYIRLTGEL